MIHTMYIYCRLLIFKVVDDPAEHFFDVLHEELFAVEPRPQDLVAVAGGRHEAVVGAVSIGAELPGPR